ncbi:MAG: phospho-sugar mutase [Eubacteriales bacterium]|nr:phospho-sugar mutase [Eubacteriales bacterium]MDD4583121.1 phospho-sugar mutase [Eubacteriales bacterium]
MEQENKFVDAYDKMEEWLSQPTLNSGLRRELTALEQRLEKDSGDREAREEITHRFYKDLDFGTGGLRGILGAGTNRMNIYTVRRVTQGLADYFAARYGKNEKKRSIAIAFDSRIQSDHFALEAGSVLAANGFQVYIYPELMPTPALSFAVRYYNCCGGIMITASHNPAEYNGYKVYNEEGCQVNPDEAAEITESIERVDCFNEVKKLDVNWETLTDKITLIPQETVEAYIQAVKKTRVGIPCTDIEVVFTPLNGSGNKPVRRILKEIGVDKIHVVPEQENPDGNFPTCPYPNPEKEEALLKGLLLCRELETPDLLLATDPDCDRLGIALRKADPETGEVSYQRMTGNQVGILLLDFICACRTLPNRPIAMKTIVSSKMADDVAAFYGVEMIDVLTGFKFIGEQIGILEAKGEENRFIFGFEESYGYLSGSYVRDKDGVNAAMLVCEAVAYYKKKGKSLFDRMEELHAQFGYYKSDLMDFTFQGASGMEKMAYIMRKLRENPPVVVGSKKVLKIVDYEISQNIIRLPKSDVLEYNLENESNIIIRPSGTEPKLKIYYLAKANTMEETQAVIDEMKTATKEWF